MKQGPRIYNLFPLLVGKISNWSNHLPRIAAMGFDWVFVNPFHYPGFSGSLYAVKDYYRLNPLFTEKGRGQHQPLRDFLDEARDLGLAVMMDLVINHTAKDADLVVSQPDWYLRDEAGVIQSPYAVDPDDPAKVTVWGDLAALDYSPRPQRVALIAYWQAVVRHYARLGFSGFRCDAAYKIPGEVWAEITGSARSEFPDIRFFAETLGASIEEVEQLRSAGFDYFFNSAKWWDFHGDWLLDQYARFRLIAPSIAFPESHDTERLAAQVSGDEAQSRLRYLFAAFFSGGVMMPVGYEFGFRHRLDVVKTRPKDWEEPLFDLSEFIREVNAMKASLPVLNEEGPQQRLTRPEHPVVALLRGSEAGRGRALALINSDGKAVHDYPARTLAASLGVDFDAIEELTPQRAASSVLRKGGRIRLQPWEMRVFHAPGESTLDSAGGNVHEDPSENDIQLPPIIIENVQPELDCGRYPVKREVGDYLEVSADILMEGHDVLSAVLKFREQAASTWHEVPMCLLDNDRWRGAFALEKNTRYRYTIEAWMDRFESWRREVGKKLEAGRDVALELEEGLLLVEAAQTRAQKEDQARFDEVLHGLSKDGDQSMRAELLLSADVQRLMSRYAERHLATSYPRELEVVVDRVVARCAAWYQMFPRSQGKIPRQSASFHDCEERLREIRDMGFDVVYLAPIHPIGRTHRKGPNNSPAAGPDDPGSPYAIGSPEGGHRAVHPELGTLEDFRRLVKRCRELDMELALDFAIQCSPDHPYLQEHPEWFLHRPDGSIKHAENPPKKYEDIVNVNFHGPHRDALWREWRDVLLFWVDQGVKIFRVDNPHTKPIPFWQWCIREVQARHPDVIFLAEAFTRPKLLKALAKAGFSQSYTYFTWRNFKQEITDYLTELTQTEVKEYLRPNFFTNTPDILPVFLQTGGRTAFKIRLVLAATLSSVYGIYNGFELCEDAALPGKEEYLDSEKYEWKVWDWDRPGHIKEYIRRVNRIRRENPALHELENLRFYTADDENVLFYGKISRGNAVFVAVNLDPFDRHEAMLEMPLAELGIPERRSFQVEELLTGRKHLWRGRHQRVHLDPEDNPAVIYRLTTWADRDYVESCL